MTSRVAIRGRSGGSSARADSAISAGVPSWSNMVATAAQIEAQKSISSRLNSDGYADSYSSEYDQARVHVISRQRIGYRPGVGIWNYLIEGVSGTGKTSVCRELRQRGYYAVNGDTELAFQGPVTGEPKDWGAVALAAHLASGPRARALVTDQTERFTFFCGGSRNFSKFVDLFDAVFVLGVDVETLSRRLDSSG
ncbi:MAG: hypothetical protein L0H25_05120 [Micrococcales bacterium]|nr:hypothetical protein [Micrococcales bacterium]